tara:strand:- start:666 stop:1808 length:1143 start_codon:yes stop_codon:yes gene_type:complete
MKHSSLTKKKSIAFVINVDWFFCSHFKEIALLAIAEGHCVYLLTTNTGLKEDIEQCGLKFIDIGLERSGKTFLNEIKYINSLYKELNIINPDVIEFITIKPVIYGALLSRFLNGSEIYAYVSGLGFLFGNNKKFALGKFFMKSFIYPFALRYKSINIIVENQEDRKIISKISKRRQDDIKVINGVGVDLSEFQNNTSSIKPTKIIIVARLLKDKGIFEFIKIAEILSKKYENLKFTIVGDMDTSNPMSLKQNQVDQINKNASIIFLGRRRDISSLLNASDIFLFPSYREGFPKVLMEAAASGLPAIAFDVAGCRDAIIDNETGYLAPFNNVDILLQKLDYLLSNHDEFKRMSINARNHAEKNFSNNAISKIHLHELLKNE